MKVPILFSFYLSGPYGKRNLKLIRRKNVYFGSNSVAKIILQNSGLPDRVDTIQDFFAVTYALFSDFLTGKYILTHYETQDSSTIGVAPKDLKVLAGRVRILFFLANKLKINGYVKNFIKKVYNLISKGKLIEAKNEIEKFALETQTYDLYKLIEQKIIEIKNMKNKVLV